MPGPESCELCGEPLGERGHDLIGGLALCRRCFLGDLERVAAARGWSVWSDHALYRDEEDGGIRYRTRVRIALASNPALTLRCRRFRWWMLLPGLLLRRARSDDPLFESNVRVWTRDRALGEAFLRQPGVESSLFDALGNLVRSSIKLSGPQLELWYWADDPHTEGEVVARAGVLAHHVERFAAAAPPRT